MRTWLVLCTLFVATTATPVYPCSSFAISAGDRPLLAKNFDWHFGGGFIVKNPVGVSRRALPLFGGDPAAWTSIHGSLTLTQYGAGLPYGGINQRGLAVEMLWLDESVYPSHAARTIGELEWIQYQLDTSATVAEVVATLGWFSIHPLGGKIHYMVADATGDRALIEFLDGIPRVAREQASSLVITNDTQRLSELAFAHLRTGTLSGNSSRVRYARLRRDVEAFAAAPGVAASFAALDRVAERGSPYRTQWQVVYDIGARQVHVRPFGAKAAATIDAATLDYASGSGTTFLDIFSTSLATDRFAVLDARANRALLGRNLPRVGIDSQLDAISAHQLDTSAADVTPLAGRSTLRVRVNMQPPGGFARIAVFSNQRELTTRRPRLAGSVLADAATREFAFYNLPSGRYVVGAFQDLDQDGRFTTGEPLAFYRPDPARGGDGFADLAFDLTGASRAIELTLVPPAPE